MHFIKKGIILPLTILVSLCGFQKLKGQILADFESPVTSPALSAEGRTAIVANPDNTGINPSDSVGYYKKIAGNWHYVTLHYPDTVKIRLNNTLTFKLRTSIQGRIFAKFYNGSEVVIEHWAPDWNFKPSPHTWTECTMDMTDAMGKQFTRLQLAACVDNIEEADVWFDDVRLSNPDAGDGTPVLEFSLSQRKALVGEELSFDASGSYDFDGEIVDYHWDFGDGNSGSGPLVSHTYTRDSIFTVRVTLTDNEGKTISRTETLTVIHPDHSLSRVQFTTSVPVTNEKIEAVFQTRDSYENVYDPDQVKIDAVISFPDGDSAMVPCFFYVPVDYVNENWIPDPLHASWMLRFTSEQVGIHQLRFILEDEGGEWHSDPYMLTVASGNKRGIVRVDPDNRQYYRHSTGEPFYPLGINAGWDEIEDYTTILNNLSSGGANTFRYWQTPFAWQSLEWSEDYYYNYQGLGIYNQEAAARSDSLLALCENLDMYMQLVIFQHGQFSENVNEMWDTNPYNMANGGYIDRAEEFFYNDSCKQQVKKLLRYIVGRWAYSKNLFAWEFFNEVQFTGDHNNQSELWFPGVLSWHDEMSRYIESIDPWNHLQTTSAATGQLAALDTIPALDNLQYHLYEERSDLLNAQIGLDRRFLDELNHTSIINGEYGLRPGADTPFDMQRNAIWNGIFTQVPRYMWVWNHYLDPEWAGLFSIPARFLEDEDLAGKNISENTPISPTHPDMEFRSLAFSFDNAYFGYIYDPSNGTGIKGATITLEEIPLGNYSISWFLPASDQVISDDSVALIMGTHLLEIPTFSKAVAFKVQYHSDYKLPLAIAGPDTAVAVGKPALLTGRQSFSPSSDILDYAWSLVLKPEGSGLTIADTTAMEFEIRPDMAGNYRFSLVVSDGSDWSAPDELTVRASLPPVALAPADTSVSVEEMYVRLDGSGSHDPDGDELFYSWILLSAPANSEKIIYEENSHEVILKTDVEGVFVLELTVSDGVSDSKPDTVNVNVVGEINDIARMLWAEAVTVYPNPAHDEVTVSATLGVFIDRIEVIDLQGKTIAEFMPRQSAPSGYTVSLESIAGQYRMVILSISGHQGTTYKKLFIH